MLNLILFFAFSKLTKNIISYIIESAARIAQSVEQWTENPRVTSSILVPGIFCEILVLKKEIFKNFYVKKK